MSINKDGLPGSSNLNYESSTPIKKKQPTTQKNGSMPKESSDIGKKAEESLHASGNAFGHIPGQIPEEEIIREAPPSKGKTTEKVREQADGMIVPKHTRPEVVEHYQKVTSAPIQINTAEVEANEAAPAMATREPIEVTSFEMAIIQHLHALHADPDIPLSTEIKDHLNQQVQKALIGFGRGLAKKTPGLWKRFVNWIYRKPRMIKTLRQQQYASFQEILRNKVIEIKKEAHQGISKGISTWRSDSYMQKKAQEILKEKPLISESIQKRAEISKGIDGSTEKTSQLPPDTLPTLGEMPKSIQFKAKYGVAINMAEFNERRGKLLAIAREISNNKMDHLTPLEVEERQNFILLFKDHLLLSPQLAEFRASNPADEMFEIAELTHAFNMIILPAIQDAIDLCKAKLTEFEDAQKENIERIKEEDKEYIDELRKIDTEYEDNIKEFDSLEEDEKTEKIKEAEENADKLRESAAKKNDSRTLSRDAKLSGKLKEAQSALKALKVLLDKSPEYVKNSTFYEKSLEITKEIQKVLTANRDLIREKKPQRK